MNRHGQVQGSKNYAPKNYAPVPLRARWLRPSRNSVHRTQPVALGNRQPFEAETTNLTKAAGDS
jgi:hypothetical protein